MTETQERFLRAVLARVPLDSVVELHLFPSLRRGLVETGVAVIATRQPDVALSVLENVDELAQPEQDAIAIDDDSPYADEPFDDADVNEDAMEVRVAEDTAAPRMRILTASYRSTIKGIERGAWVVDVQEEADAPLDAVEAVLRGVRHRSTEPADPELITHDALAELMVHTTIAPAA